MPKSADTNKYAEGFRPEIRRARLDSLTIYDVTDSELELLKKGSPNSLYLNFAIFLISTAVAFTIALFSTDIPAGKVYSFFLVSTIVGYIGGILLIALWLKNYESLSMVVQTIEKRLKLPPQGEAHIPLDQTHSDVAGDSALEIVSAYYGSEKRQVEITNQLGAKIKDERLIVKACNEIAGEDPHEGAAKKLLVRYRSYGSVYHVEVDEGEVLALPE